MVGAVGGCWSGGWLEWWLVVGVVGGWSVGWLLEWWVVGVVGGWSVGWWLEWLVVGVLGGCWSGGWWLEWWVVHGWLTGASMHRLWPSPVVIPCDKLCCSGDGGAGGDGCHGLCCSGEGGMDCAVVVKVAWTVL